MYIFILHHVLFVLQYFTAHFTKDNKPAKSTIIFLCNWKVTCHNVHSSLAKYNIFLNEFTEIAIICIPRSTASSLCASCVTFWKKIFLLRRSLMYFQENVMFWNVLQSCLDIRKCLLRCKDIFSQIQWCLKFA